MEATLIDLGLSKKEAKLYLQLVNNGSQTAAQIAKAIKESRTNTYMILNQLIDRDLVIPDETEPIRTFVSNDPNKLRDIISTKQLKLNQSGEALKTALPQLNSMFSLGTHKPGVVYFQGITGFKLLLEDMSKSKADIDLIASDTGPATEETWDVLLKGLAKRKARGIRTRAIFHQAAKNWPTIKTIESRGFEVGFWSKKPLEGEIVIYNQKVALTVYEPKLIVTVITNDVLARTFKTIFEEIWSSAAKTI